MRRLLLTLLTLAAVASVGGALSTETTGVVLMHGNTDLPDRPFPCWLPQSKVLRVCC